MYVLFQMFNFFIWLISGFYFPKIYIDARLVSLWNLLSGHIIHSQVSLSILIVCMRHLDFPNAK